MNLKITVQNGGSYSILGSIMKELEAYLSKPSYQVSSDDLSSVVWIQLNIESFHHKVDLLQEVQLVEDFFLRSTEQCPQIYLYFNPLGLE